MPTIIPKYPLDLSGRASTNLVPGEKQLLLARGNTPYRVVSFSNGGFYTPSLKVYDKNFKLLTANIDYIATYKHQDASDYIGIEVCSAVVILNTQLTDYVLLGGQLVGSDYAFSLTVEDDTIAYLDGLGMGVVPVWAGYIGDEPQWYPGELQEDRWERFHYGYLNASIERLAAMVNSGNGAAEDIERANIRTIYQTFIQRFQGQVATHINDQANPHAVNKSLVGLPNLQNYAVADKATAEAGTSGTHYMTQRGVFDMLAKFAALPLQNHLDHLYTAHNPTAEQLNTYVKSAFDARIATKLPVNGTAQDADGVMGTTVANPGQVVNLSSITAYNEARANLNAANFNTGQADPARLGRGTPTTRTVLMALGDWVDFDYLYANATAGEGTDIYYAGSQGDTNTGLANISTTYANAAAYPVGTIVIFLVYGVEAYSYGNGGTASHSYYSFRAAIRGSGGWFVLG